MYVLLTARQPFSSPKTNDPMEVMRRIVDERWPIKFPPYMSSAAKVRAWGETCSLLPLACARSAAARSFELTRFTLRAPIQCQDLISRLLERKPAKRLGMLQGRAADIKNHKWFSVRRA